MPRTARATESRLSTVPKRNSRRNASKQQSVYDTVDLSPVTKTDESNESHSDVRSTRSAESPGTSAKERHTSSSSTTILIENNLTPTRNRPSVVKRIPMAMQESGVPGFEALEAVNSLYQQLKDSCSQIDNLHRQNASLSLDIGKQKKLVERLQAELKLEKEKSTNAQKLYEKEIQKLHQNSDDDLRTTLDSLRHFGSAAHNLMPLLDILADSAEIQYDEKTENLYQVFNKHK